MGDSDKVSSPKPAPPRSRTPCNMQSAHHNTCSSHDTEARDCWESGRAGGCVTQHHVSRETRDSDSIIAISQTGNSSWQLDWHAMRGAGLSTCYRPFALFPPLFAVSGKENTSLGACDPCQPPREPLGGRFIILETRLRYLDTRDSCESKIRGVPFVTFGY